jgi:hypothetical protein
MIKILPETSGDLLAVKASNKLTDADYQETFIPKLEEIIKQYGKGRILLIFDDNFKGWEPKALWDDARFGIKHMNDFEKIALVGGKKWVEWGVKIFAHLMKGEVKTFDGAQQESAQEWVKA